MDLTSMRVYLQIVTENYESQAARHVSKFYGANGVNYRAIR